MSDDRNKRAGNEGSPFSEDRPPADSVLEHIASRTGEAPRINLRDEDPARVPAPVIAPLSEERLSTPRGRGAYQLMGEIARGGMGVILKGHDTDLGRDVALKVLDKRLAGHPEVVRRFIEEAQIGGQLQHPGIVPVYELGLMADERPYFTMKLVKGRTLATLLAERETPASDRRRLVDVFEAMCQTMAYAHSRGVIHRDLKPANVMVGAFGEVQVVDWGLAKVLARGGTADERRARQVQSHLTVLETVRSGDGSSRSSDSMIGSVMGTPAYMPPEQASGLVDRLDERSDVFALGAILCEILTGLPPYVGERDEVIAAAAQADQEDALRRLDACGADPEFVKLAKQCLLAAPAARPAHAGVVAERVHGYLVSIEERAHAARVEAAEARVRAQQERKAHRLTLALAASILAATVVGGGAWLYVQEERAAQLREESARARAAAQEELELSTAVDETLREASAHQGAERWFEALGAAERARALAEGGDAGPELLARVDGILASLRRGESEARRRVELEAANERLLSELQEVREPRWNVPVVATSYAEAFRRHGLDLDAGEARDAAARLTERGLGSEIALVLDAWSATCRAAGDAAGALRLLQIAQVVDRDPLRSDLREALHEGDISVLRDIVELGLVDQPPITIELVAAGLARLGEREAAKEVYRAGIDLHPGDFSLHYRLGLLLTPPELEFGLPVEMEEGVVCYHAALALRPGSTPARYYLSRLYYKLGHFERALAQCEAALESTPDDLTLLFYKALDLSALGEAERALELSLALCEHEEPSWLAPWSHYRVGRILERQGRTAEAIEHFERAIEGSPRQWAFHDALFSATVASRPLEEIERVQQRILGALPSNKIVRAGALNNVAWVLATTPREEARNLDEALRLAEKAVELDPGQANEWNTLGIARYYAGDYEGAVADLRQSVRLSGGGDAFDWLFLAMAYHRAGDDAAARVWYERAVLWMDVEQSDTLTSVMGGAYNTPYDELVRFRAEADALFGE